MEMTNPGGRRAWFAAAFAGPLLVGCTLDITEVADPVDAAPEARPAVLVVRTELQSASAADGGRLRTLVLLHPGVDDAGIPRFVPPQALELHGTVVEPEILQAPEGVALRWMYEDAAPVRRHLLHLTLPSVPGLATPLPVEIQVGADLEPSGDITLGPSDDLTLEVEVGEGPSGLLHDMGEQWYLRVGGLTVHARGPPSSTLVVPHAWLEGLAFPATLDFSFIRRFRRDSGASPWYEVDATSALVVRREVSRSPG